MRSGSSPRPCANIDAAIRTIKNYSVELFLCDYHLGEQFTGAGAFEILTNKYGFNPTHRVLIAYYPSDAIERECFQLDSPVYSLSRYTKNSNRTVSTCGCLGSQTSRCRLMPANGTRTEILRLVARGFPEKGYLGIASNR